MTEMARTGLSVRRENDYLPIERFGLLEETFFSWSWTPLYGGTDKVRLPSDRLARKVYASKR